MPVQSVKELYLATSIEKLDSEGTIADVSKQKTSSLCKSAYKLYKSAEECYLAKDEEKAYVQFSKYVDLILSIKKRPDFAKEKTNKQLADNAIKAMSKAESLKESLLKRYSILKEIEVRKKIEKNGDLHNEEKPKEESIKSVAKPDMENGEHKEKGHVADQTISSERLYALFQNPHLHSSIILMDVRSMEDFSESHLKHNCCINVPQEILRAGITAASLEQLLPSESLPNWRKRGEAEYIILIDYDFNDALIPGSFLHSLRQAMCVWDQNCSPKNSPMILQGGYRDWMFKYPMLTTKALSFPLFNNTARTVIADVSAVEYPNLDEQTVKNKDNLSIENVLFKKTNISQNNVDGLSTNSGFESERNNQVKSAPTFNRNAKPNLDRGMSADNTSIKKTFNNDLSNRPLGLFSKNTNVAAEKESPLTQFPTVDRKLKPPSLTSEKSLSNLTNLPTSDLKNESSLMTALSKEESLAKETLDLAKEQYLKENEFEKLRLRKELEAEESKRVEIQKQEDSLWEKLKQLEEESRLKDLDYNKVKEENVKMRKLLEENMDKEHQKQKERDILEAENTKKKLQEEVEKLRELRKKKEQSLKRVEAMKYDANHREIASANSGLKKYMNHEKETIKQSNSHEYTIPLSKQNSTSDGTSKGLVRSHSSPNIAEMVNQEDCMHQNIPVIDRTLKPKATSPIQHSEINRARLRNLNPMYGNSLVRPATGIRNLGNTCFMNSIIQCLSNTIPLAQYFTSRDYTRDINRENRQGTGGELAEEFAVIIQALWMGQYKSFSPKDFKNTVSKCLAVCIGNEQQDSHEFLVVLMEKLHADLNKNSERLELPKLDNLPEQKAKEIFWRHHKTVNCSRISDIFDGLLKSTLTCMVCQKTSNSFEVFSCLSLPISSNRCSLRDCLQHFFKPEKMSGEAAWDCPKCKQKKDAEKRLYISRLPNILIIQLKRFSYDGMWRRKLQTHVDFDTTLEMPYENNNELSSRSYNLYGIVNHYGTLEGGHYTAYCKNNFVRKWYKYDDHEVSEMSSSDIKTSAAYLLFYCAADYS